MCQVGVVIAILEALREGLIEGVLDLQERGEDNEHLADALWHVGAAAEALRLFQQGEAHDKQSSDKR
jgi:hypothetical protein